MSELAFPSEQDVIQIKLDSGDQLQNDLSMEVFRASGVNKWAEERHREHGDYIDPKILYITNYTNPSESHHVAWVYHRGIKMAGGDIVPYAVHHVTCDCMIEFDEHERLDRLHECRSVHSVLKKRADEVSDDLGVAKIMEPLKASESDDGARIMPLGVEVIKHTILQLIATDLAHPEAWPANIRSGILLVDTVARIVKESPDVVLTLLNNMNQQGLVEYNRAYITPGFDILEE